MKIKLAVVAVIIALSMVAITNYRQRVRLTNQLASGNIGQTDGATSEQKAEAKRIIDSVKKHMMLSSGAEPTVAKIVDIDALRKRNDFYKGAKNGDYLIVTTTRAILYDPTRDIIIDTIPVQLQANQSSSVSSAAKK